MSQLLLKKARKIFEGASVEINYQCSVTGRICDHHTEDCEYRVACVVSKRRMKIVGWFEGDHLIKTNPKPGKAYLRKIFGIKKESKRGKPQYKSYLKTNRTDANRDQERTRRNQRRDKDNKKGNRGKD